ncbi:MAG: threonine-phosphate decarboxylase CobD [Sporomusaceae bacterium]|nr:threonine-phosphate decarboxylase CobD [Sporomusaceae bacterium]
MKNEHGGNIYAENRKNIDINPSEWLDYSANINPLGLADSVRNALSGAIDSVLHYPDTQAHDLKQAISVAYDIPFHQITPGNGAVELFYLLCHVHRPKKVLILAPTFSEYERSARASGAEIIYHYLDQSNDFQVSFETLMEQFISEKPDLFFFCNPNNPTGQLVTRQMLRPLIEQAQKQKCLVVVDESFLDFISDPVVSCKPFLQEFENLLISHSLTKFYAIPGLRLGFMAASAALTAKLHEAKDPWNVNSLAQIAGVAALSDHVFGEKSKSYIDQEKGRFHQGLCQINGLKPLPPSVNYILVNTEAAQLTASVIAQRLKKEGILIRDCSNYEGLNAYYLRLAVKLAKQNDRLLYFLEKAVKGELHD